MSAAEIGDVDAIHPGYGFLAENAHFAEVCESCNIKFIGPPAQAMQAMGDKNAARAAARKAGVPVTPGSDGIVETEQDAIKIARKIGYPVMIKAVAGGGGRGMRVAHNEPSLQSAFHSARHEAEKAFGNDQVYIEKLIVNPHHIEFQIMADSHGHIVHLGERDCSIQRRNQKVIEECPSPLMTPGLRKKMGHAAVKLAESVGYENAGTIEFLVDKDRHFYFIEMNTRIQVEHTITEEVYGCDLVKEQIRIAAGEPLSPHVAHATPAAARDPMPDQCRRSGERFSAVAGPNRFLLCARRTRRSNRLARLHRLHRAALLRFPDRKTDHGRGDADQRSIACDGHSTSITSPASRRRSRFIAPSCATRTSATALTTPALLSESCHRANSISDRGRFDCMSETQCDECAVVNAVFTGSLISATSKDPMPLALLSKSSKAALT